MTASFSIEMEPLGLDSFREVPHPEHFLPELKPPSVPVTADPVAITGSVSPPGSKSGKKKKTTPRKGDKGEGKGPGWAPKMAGKTSPRKSPPHTQRSARTPSPGVHGRVVCAASQ